MRRKGLVEWRGRSGNVTEKGGVVEVKLGLPKMQLRKKREWRSDALPHQQGLQSLDRTPDLETLLPFRACLGLLQVLAGLDLPNSRGFSPQNVGNIEQEQTRPDHHCVKLWKS